jgi:hypothetical protein
MKWLILVVPVALAGCLSGPRVDYFPPIVQEFANTKMIDRDSRSVWADAVSRLRGSGYNAKGAYPRLEMTFGNNPETLARGDDPQIFVDCGAMVLDGQRHVLLARNPDYTFGNFAATWRTVGRNSMRGTALLTFEQIDSASTKITIVATYTVSRDIMVHQVAGLGGSAAIGPVAKIERRDIVVETNKRVPFDETDPASNAEFCIPTGAFEASVLSEIT